MTEVVGIDAAGFQNLFQAYGVVEVGEGSDLDRVAHLLQGGVWLLVVRGFVQIVRAIGSSTTGCGVCSLIDVDGDEQAERRKTSRSRE